MAQLVQTRPEVNSPISGTLYTLYTVPAGVNFFCTGAAAWINSATTTDFIGIVTSTLTEAAVDATWNNGSTGNASASRDFTTPMVFPAGTVIQYLWTGSGTPNVGGIDLNGFLE